MQWSVTKKKTMQILKISYNKEIKICNLTFKSLLLAILSGDKIDGEVIGRVIIAESSVAGTTSDNRGSLSCCACC